MSSGCVSWYLFNGFALVENSSKRFFSPAKTSVDPALGGGGGRDRERGMEGCVMLWLEETSRQYHGGILILCHRPPIFSQMGMKTQEKSFFSFMEVAGKLAVSFATSKKG